MKIIILINLSTSDIFSINNIYLKGGYSKTIMSNEYTKEEINDDNLMISTGIKINSFLEAEGRFLVDNPISVPDNQKPTITLLGANPLKINKGSTFTDPGAIANDNIDGDISSNIIVTGNVNISVPGEYVLKYNVSDAAGNAAIEKSRTIKVIDSKVELTYQSKSYDQTGAEFIDNCSLKDDGFYKRGKNANYTRDPIGIVTDHITGLKWEDTPHTGGTDGSNLLMLWNGSNGTQGGPAETYCANLTLGGLSWRLPEINELLTIADKSLYNPAINPVFQNIISEPYSAERLYWSNTPKQKTPMGTTTQINYNVKFVDGRDQNGLEGYVGNPKSVRCVSGPVMLFNETNYTKTGDIVTDNITNLQWSDDAAALTKSWRDAINYCENFNLRGYTDWSRDSYARKGIDGNIPPAGKDSPQYFICVRNK